MSNADRSSHRRNDLSNSSYKRVKLAVVGLGRVAQSHLPAIIGLNDKVELHAIVSRDERKAAAEAQKWNAPKFFASFSSALLDPDIEAVLLLLPHDLHASFSVEASRAGKHVLVEKPMALNTREALIMVEAAEQNGVTLMVGQSRRFFEPVMDSIRRIKNKEIGDLLNINALFLSYMDKPATPWWTEHSKIGGFIIPLWGSHILDYILWAYDEEPETVYAQGYSNNPNWSGEDEVAISLRFSGGRMANVLMSFNAGNRPTDEEGLSGRRIWSTQNSIYERYIIGTNGFMNLKDEYDLYLNSSNVSNSERDHANFSWQLEEFVDSIRQHRSPLASGQEVLRVTRVIDACFESIKENRLIRLK